jgi:adenylate kinase family enzyme
MHNHGMRRVSVVGSSSSGKTRASRLIADRLGVPHLELDSLYHQAKWEPLDARVFRALVTDFIAGDGWVVDGNYTSLGVARLVWPAADTVVWLDPPKRVVMSRVIRRTLRRAITRQELWNGNREPLSNLYSRDPHRNIIVWAWTRFDAVRERYERMLTDGTWDHLEAHRVRTRRDVASMLRSIEAH